MDIQICLLSGTTVYSPKVCRQDTWASCTLCCSQWRFLSFMHDNARPTTWLVQNVLETWAVCSLDLNLIEHVWDTLKRHIVPLLTAHTGVSVDYPGFGNSTSYERNRILKPHRIHGEQLCSNLSFSRGPHIILNILHYLQTILFFVIYMYPNWWIRAFHSLAIIPEH